MTTVRDFNPAVNDILSTLLNLRDLATVEEVLHLASSGESSEMIESAVDLAGSLRTAADQIDHLIRYSATPIEELATALGVNPSTVRRRIAELGIYLCPLPNPRKGPSYIEAVATADLTRLKGASPEDT